MIFILSVSAALAQFVQKPYVQLGDHAGNMAREAASILWHAPDEKADWLVESKTNSDKKWAKGKTALLRTVNVAGTPPHRVYEAVIGGLRPGEPFTYRVTRNGSAVFEASAKARPKPGQPYTMAIVGDIAQASEGQKNLAWHMGLAKPDFFVAVGDVVYSRGRVSEYYEKWFPIHNCDTPAEATCAATLRSTISVAIPGNHDTAPTVDLTALPDAMAYFYYWSMPANGPVTDAAPGKASALAGSVEAIATFRKTAPNFPRMGMYSFDYSDVHWTMLDSNPYVDWTDPALRDWVRKDIKSASKAKWRFVGLHHPPFQSSKAHFNDQWMRLLSEIFEQEKVDIVFSGHVHNYQRTYPMKFRADAADSGSPMKKGPIGGKWTLDKAFDGETRTKPDGVVWIVTGAGGANLYNPEQENDPSSWQEFTTKFASTIHSFSLVEVSPKAVTLRQIAADGRELDRFTVTHE